MTLTTVGLILAAGALSFVAGWAMRGRIERRVRELRRMAIWR